MGEWQAGSAKDLQGSRSYSDAELAKLNKNTFGNNRQRQRYDTPAPPGRKKKELSAGRLSFFCHLASPSGFPGLLLHARLFRLLLASLSAHGIGIPSPPPPTPSPGRHSFQPAIFLFNFACRNVQLNKGHKRHRMPRQAGRQGGPQKRKQSHR